MTGDLAKRAVRSFAFGPFVLIPERQVLLENETPVRIGGRSLDILTALVERPGELVSKSELLSLVWPNTIVEESNLKVNMVALRRALGEGPGASQYIATVVGRGYRFVGTGHRFGRSIVGPRRCAPAQTQFANRDNAHLRKSGYDRGHPTRPG